MSQQSASSHSTTITSSEPLRLAILQSTKFSDLDFYAPNIKGYGLPNVSETTYDFLMQRVEACDSGLRSMASVQDALVMYPIHAFGSEKQKEMATRT